MKIRIIALSCITALAAAAPLAASAGGRGGWEEIDVAEAPMTVKLADGSRREISPSCSGGPQLTASGLARADEDFKFFVQKGNPNRLLFILDGGGACWDAASCIGSALNPESAPLYSQTADETTAGLAAIGGIMDSDNRRNPYKNYTKVFVPYCTGDIHWGSRDTTYTLPPEQGGPLSWEIKHRGTDNFLAVLDWLQRKGKKWNNLKFSRLRDVTVTGLSAGGYGATLAFPYVAELTGKKTSLNLISDAAIGVQTQGFYATTLYNPLNPGSESWGIAGNIPAWLLLGSSAEEFLTAGIQDVSQFQALLFATIADYKPEAKLASLTTTLDAVQVSFYSLQVNLFDFATGQPKPEAFPIWNAQALQSLSDTENAVYNGNYHYYLETGFTHTFLFNDDLFYDRGSNGITLARWITQMIKPGNRDWQSVVPLP